MLFRSDAFLALAEDLVGVRDGEADEHADDRDGDQDLEQGEALARTLGNNPAAILLKLTRAVFLDYELPSTQQLLWIATLTVLLFVAGFLTFWRSERRNG